MLPTTERRGGWRNTPLNSQQEHLPWSASYSFLTKPVFFFLLQPTLLPIQREGKRASPSRVAEATELGPIYAGAVSASAGPRDAAASHFAGRHHSFSRQGPMSLKAQPPSHLHLPPKSAGRFSAGMWASSSFW